MLIHVGKEQTMHFPRAPSTFSEGTTGPSTATPVPPSEKVRLDP